MRRRLMAAILRMLGREPRRGSGAFSLARRRTDRDIAQRRMTVARVEEVERRLANYQRVRFPRP